MPDAAPTLWLLRHGETPWTVLGRHTSRTDLALTPLGEQQAVALGRRLARRPLGLILMSPLIRASETCRLAGYAALATSEPNLQEWVYGALEGKTTAEIRIEQPMWIIWEAEAPRGETPDNVALRANRVIARALAADRDVALFGHGHQLRVLAARWLGLPPGAGGSLALDTASLSMLGMERERRVIRQWNEICHLEDAR